MPALRTSLLAEALEHFTARGWAVEDLDRFRMDAGDQDDDEQTDDDADDQDDGDDQDDSGDDDDTDEESDDDSPAIKRLRRENARWRTQSSEWRKLKRDLGMDAEQIRAALKKGRKRNQDSDDTGDGELDEDAIRDEAERKANDRVNRRLVRAEVRAIAADLFADPTDAAPNLDLDDYEVDDDGDVDEDAIREDLLEVLERKPHLAKKKTGAGAGNGGADGDRRMKRNRGQGARNRNKPSSDERAEARLKRLGITKDTA